MVTLPVSWLASRTTTTSRSVYEVTEVSVTPPKPKSSLRSASMNLVVDAFADLRHLAALAGIHRRLVVVNGLPRML